MGAIILGIGERTILDSEDSDDNPETESESKSSIS